MITRRSLIGLLAGAALDPERLLWVLGKKLISIPVPPKMWRMTNVRLGYPRINWVLVGPDGRKAAFKLPQRSASACGMAEAVAQSQAVALSDGHLHWDGNDSYVWPDNGLLERALADVVITPELNR